MCRWGMVVAACCALGPIGLLGLLLDCSAGTFCQVQLLDYVRANVAAGTDGAVQGCGAGTSGRLGAQHRRLACSAGGIDGVQHAPTGTLPPPLQQPPQEPTVTIIVLPCSPVRDLWPPGDTVAAGSSAAPGR